MKAISVQGFIFGLVVLTILAGCASSGVDKFATADPEIIISEIDIRQSESDPGLYAFAGPPIDARAGFGAFATGMLKGGSDLGSSVSLHGAQTATGEVAHRILASFQYTNIGGVYRHYDRAGIAGADDLIVTPVDSHKQYSPNGVIMTETVSVDIDDDMLRRNQATDLVLRVGTDSGNLETLTVPKNYIIAYLRAIDRQAVSQAAR